MKENIRKLALELLSFKFTVKFTTKDSQVLNLVTFTIVTLNLAGLNLVALSPGKFDT